MAEINDQGTVRARCPGCRGALSSFEWRTSSGTLDGVPGGTYRHVAWGDGKLEYRIFRCAGCGRGGLGTIAYRGSTFPGVQRQLLDFYPEARERLKLPADVPVGIQNEFREGEKCLENTALRAAAGMFRSVLDKTLRANGYKIKGGTTLEQQIDLAASDGVITAARKRRAHEEIRVLGNDVLHDEWHEIAVEDVEAARHYAQRVLEDFYDDRDSVLRILREAQRVPDEDKQASGDAT